MFQQFKNINTAFRHIKLFSYLLIFACMGISCFAIYESYRSADAAKQRIYILASGKALEAIAADRKDNIPVELRDHVKMFHHYFFTLDPDDKQVRANISQALYYADGSAKSAYDDLREKGFYANLISGNVSQRINVDSIQLDMNQYPYYWKCFATETLTRSTAISTRSLVTQGYARNVERSDNNSHGFLIERWQTLKNDSLNTKYIRQ